MSSFHSFPFLSSLCLFPSIFFLNVSVFLFQALFLLSFPLFFRVLTSCPFVSLTLSFCNVFYDFLFIFPLCSLFFVFKLLPSSRSLCWLYNATVLCVVSTATGRVYNWRCINCMNLTYLKEQLPRKEDITRSL